MHLFLFICQQPYYKYFYRNYSNIIIFRNSAKGIYLLEIKMVREFTSFLGNGLATVQFAVVCIALPVRVTLTDANIVKYSRQKEKWLYFSFCLLTLFYSINKMDVPYITSILILQSLLPCKMEWQSMTLNFCSLQRLCIE